MKSLLTHTDKNVAAVMFNVKSRDLLYLDQPNDRLQQDGWSRQVYADLHIGLEPFTNARFFAPADPHNNPAGTQSLRQVEIERF